MKCAECVRLQREGKPFKAQPTIIFEPLNLVSQMFNEIVSLWAKFFNVADPLLAEARPHPSGNMTVADEAATRALACTIATWPDISHRLST